MSYRDHLLSDQRLALLRLLREQPAQRSNSSVLTKLLGVLGHPVSRDWMRTQLAWLAEQGLVKVQVVEDIAGLVVVDITERGNDCANGLSHVPGVARPGE